MASVKGVKASSVGVVCTESTGANKLRALSSTLTVGGCSLYLFSKGMMKSAGSTEDGSALPITEESRSIADLPQSRACLPTWFTSSIHRVSSCSVESKGLGALLPGISSTSILSQPSPSPWGVMSLEIHPIHSAEPFPAAKTLPTTQAVLQKLFPEYTNPPQRFAIGPSLFIASVSFSSIVDMRKWYNPSPGSIRPEM